MFFYEKNILIVGAGPVGLTAAHELARRGFNPRIIDKAQGFAPITESRALAIHMRTVDIFKASGIGTSFRKAGNLITQMRFAQDDRQLAMLDLTEHERENSGILVLAQGKTERIIAKALAVYKITPEWNTTLISVQSSKGDVSVRIKNPNGKVSTVTYDLIIGCDGAHSAVRKSGGFSFKGASMDAQWTLVDVTYKTAINPHIGQANFIKAFGAFAALPIHEHCVRYIGNHARVHDLIPRKEDVLETMWQSNFKVSYRMVSQLSRGNVFLAGDAAHIHSPVGGRGMNLGIEDAAWLAWMISQGTQKDYSSARVATILKTLKETKMQTRQITSTSFFAQTLRTYILPLALKFKFIRRRIINNMLALDTPAPPWLSG